jgi:hypothetical protein
VTVAVYTIAEAAAVLRKTPRWLVNWLRDNPVDATGTPFYTPAGRTKTFDDSELFRIRVAMREAEQCRLRSSRPATRKRKTSISAARTSESEWTKAARLANDPSLAEFSSGSKPASKEASTHRVKLELVATNRHS